MATIIDVIENFFTLRQGQDVANLPGRDLWRFGEEVQRFAASYDPPPLDEKRYPVYLGGWPSANFFAADHGQLVLSTLLYSGQVLAKDPLSDWFAPEQYRVEHVLSSRQGYLDEEGQPNIAGTRRFLANVVPALRALKPLIESGAIILVPGEPFFNQQQDSIDKLRSSLRQRLAADPELITGKFQPSDLAVDDRRRGAFTFAGGDREEQLRKAIDVSLRYFAREWLLAQGYGAEYVAPWPYEQYVCQEGLDKVLGEIEHYRVINALLNSQLPIFQGLSPRVVADLRDDTTFADFRANLFEVYRGLPNMGSGAEFSRTLAQTEETMLRPVLERAEREAKFGLLHRLGIEATEIGMSMGARVIFDALTGQVGWHTAASEGVGVLADRVRVAKRSRSPLSVWTKLYRHNRQVVDELRETQPRPGLPPQLAPWAIDEQPSMNVRVTPGLLLLDDPELPEKPELVSYSEGNYRLCDCGSGLKWKFCCQGIYAH